MVRPRGAAPDGGVAAPAEEGGGSGAADPARSGPPLVGAGGGSDPACVAGDPAGDKLGAADGGVGIDVDVGSAVIVGLRPAVE